MYTPILCRAVRAWIHSLPELQTGSPAVSGLQSSGVKPGTESTWMRGQAIEADDLGSPRMSNGQVGWAVDFSGSDR